MRMLTWLFSEWDVIVRRGVMGWMARRGAAADRIIAANLIHIVRDAANGATRRGIAVVLGRRDTAAKAIDRLALVFRPDRKQDQRLIVPIVRVVAVCIADRIGVGLVEDHALIFAFEVKDQFLICADFFALNTAHGDADFSAAKV